MKPSDEQAIRRLPTPSRRAFREASRRALGSGGMWACLLLALLAFAGGLLLAMVGVKGATSEPRISGMAPELLYQRPAKDGEVSGSDATILATPEDPPSLRGAEPFESLAATGESEKAPVTSLWSVRTIDAADGALRGAEALNSGEESWLGFGAPAGLASRGTTPAAGSPPIETGYAALTLPSVPEPSTWMLLIGGAVGLAAAVRSRRKER